MQLKATIDKEKFGSEYLIVVQSLSEELVGATAAIARNDVGALEKHIESQQKLCAQLLSLEELRQLLQTNSAAWTSVICALRTLVQNNRVYETLLTTSGRSHRVLLALCKSYKDSSSHAADRDQIAGKLSCEI
jgi:hypothetical protein